MMPGLSPWIIPTTTLADTVTAGRRKMADTRAAATTTGPRLVPAVRPAAATTGDLLPIQAALQAAANAVGRADRRPFPMNRLRSEAEVAVAETAEVAEVVAAETTRSDITGASRRGWAPEMSQASATTAFPTARHRARPDSGQILGHA